METGDGNTIQLEGYAFFLLNIWCIYLCLCVVRYCTGSTVAFVSAFYIV